MSRRRASGAEAKPAIVLGTELPRATAIIRSLGRAGIPVIALDHRLGMPGACSRYVGESRIAPHAEIGESEKQGSESRWFFSSAQALERLEALGRERGGVLFPTNDEYYMLVSKHHARLARLFEICVPPWPLVEPAMEKQRSYRIADEAGVRVPEYFVLRTDAEAERILASLDFGKRSYLFKLDPWVRGAADPESGAMTRPAGPDAAAALERCREIHARVGCWPILQEVVPGEASVCIAASLIVDPERKLRLAYCSQRIFLSTYSRGGETVHPYELGQSVFAESIHDDEALAAAARIVRAAGLYGAITVEFRRSLLDGSLQFIKVDPRFINATSLSTALGLDFPLAMYRIMTGGELRVPASYPDGVAWIWLDRYWRALTTQRESRSVRRQLLRALRQAHRLRAFASLSLSDPGPFRKVWEKERAWQRRRKRRDGRA